MTSARTAFATTMVLGTFCTACAGGPHLPSLSNALPLPDLSKLAVPSIATEPSVIPIASADVYSRIARGANTCWFGPRGRLSKTHIFHADAAPSMNGGGVEIVVHERAADQPKPWGYKAFRVILTEGVGFDGTPGAGGTTITVDNTRIADAEAARMRAEVFQWASGIEGCKADTELDKVPDPVPVAAPVPPPNKTPARKPAPKATPAAATATATPK